MPKHERLSTDFCDAISCETRFEGMKYLMCFRTENVLFLLCSSNEFETETDLIP